MLGILWFIVKLIFELLITGAIYIYLMGIGVKVKDGKIRVFDTWHEKNED